MSTKRLSPKLTSLLVVIAVLGAHQFSILSRQAPFFLARDPGSSAPPQMPVNTTRRINTTGDFSLLIGGNHTGLLSHNESFPLMNDKTIPWSNTIHRLWLDVATATNRPPAQLMITDFGWNGEDHDLGLRLIRTKRSRELLRGVMNHPWFHPTAWEDYNSGRLQIDNLTRYYIFLDIETCYERNYPIYADGGLNNNSDQEFGRGMFRGRRRHCDAVRKALNSPVMRTPAGAKIVYFDCAGNGPSQSCASREETPSPRVALASISAHESQHFRHLDQGLPPPAPRAVELTEKQLSDIDSCNESSRPYLLTFAGRDKGELRHRLFDLHNGKDIIIERKPRGLNMPEYLGKNNYSYAELLEQSKFAAIPRGDNLFSYRFTEALSAGAIPVVYADQWVLPFRKTVVDWQKCCALVVQEARVKATVQLMGSISDERRCELRKNGYEAYHRYMKTGEGVVAGLIEGLEHLATLRDR